MPKLLLFVPCEKLLVDENGNPTLVCILQNVGVQVKKDAQIPEDAVAPREWDVVTLLEAQEGERGRFVQRLELILPNGTVSRTRSRIEFDLTEQAHRNKVHVNGFPIGLPGTYTLRLFLDPASTRESDTPVATYPIRVTHERV